MVTGNQRILTLPESLEKVKYNDESLPTTPSSLVVHDAAILNSGCHSRGWVSAPLGWGSRHGDDRIS